MKESNILLLQQSTRSTIFSALKTTKGWSIDPSNLCLISRLPQLFLRDKRVQKCKFALKLLPSRFYDKILSSFCSQKFIKKTINALENHLIGSKINIFSLKIFFMELQSPAHFLFRVYLGFSQYPGVEM